jgi:solute carrier family 6 (neurotransmitter transporter, GABA) member 1
MMITGFILANIGMVIIVLGFVVPRYYDVFVPPHRRGEGVEDTAPCEPKGQVVARAINDRNNSHDKTVDGGEHGLTHTSSDEDTAKAEKTGFRRFHL